MVALHFDEMYSSTQRYQSVAFHKKGYNIEVTQYDLETERIALKKIQSNALKV